MINERNNALLDSCRQGDLEKVWRLLEEADYDGGVSIHARDDAEHSTCLHFASQYGHDDLIRLLIEERGAAGAGVNEVNIHGNTPLHLASLEQDRTSTVRLLIGSRLGANVHATNLGQQTPLLLASFFGRTETVRVLAEAGANVNHVADHGLTALHQASSGNRYDTVQLLLHLGAHVNAKTTVGTEWTALNFAIQRNHVETVRVLLINDEGRHADVNTRDASDATPLHFAASDGLAIIARMLLAQPLIKVNAQDKTGRTPLHTGKFLLFSF
jgi:ankyrin repeat protein